MMAQLRDAGAHVIALEASSHGLEEGRLDAVDINVAVLTNFGRDHLDYHDTLAQYKSAKARLFSWPGVQSVVLNGQDELGQELATTLADSAPVSSSVHADLRLHAESIELHNQGMRFGLVDNGTRFEQQSNLMGSFNVENLLACYGVLRALGMAANDASASLESVEQVPGRIEQFNGVNKPTVIVDFAHTPQALAAVMDAVRKHCEGSLWVVFGCGGDRDPGKRAPMGHAAEQADHIIVTDDNPRTEKSETILADIVAGMDKPDRAIVIADRTQAIGYALSHAASNDVVLVAGKGHEDYQIIGTKKRDFSDRLVVRRFMQEAI
ncbi:UNVERIFIED_CONTAM: hypothetical protein GTU68_031967 [Idotea baltica]|nr:hypothetical protein [Idotea baltica]